ncbi:MAG TPA: hypothetical protein VLZ78_04885 [Terrimesophilobacter sp.]|nr:hypothetical protein [Terrimesophilobacter sp.]
MHKTMFAALIVGASALSVPAFAQVKLGATGQAGARVNAGAVAQDSMRTANQVGARATDTAHDTTRMVDRKARHTTHEVVNKTRSTVDDNGKADASANANASTRTDAAGANAHVEAGAGLDTAATAGKAGEAGNGVGGEVRQAAHSAIQSTDRTAGSVGDAVNGTSASGAVKAGTKANGEVRGH